MPGMTRQEILCKYEPLKENLLLILHELQNNSPSHFISAVDITEVADYLNITQSSVYGVITYYSMFSISPRGRHIIRVCESPVCEITGSESIVRSVENILGISPGETTDDGFFTLETSECLGRCAEAPCLLIDETFYGYLDTESIVDIINAIRNRG